jgi:hypothetical protein
MSRVIKSAFANFVRPTKIMMNPRMFNARVRKETSQPSNNQSGSGVSHKSEWTAYLEQKAKNPHSPNWTDATTRGHGS